MFHRLLSFVLLLTLFTTAVAEEARLDDRFQFPKQGHFELLYSIHIEVKGLSLKSEADVLALQKRIEAIPFDEERITSHKLLIDLGLQRIERPLPTPRPGVTNFRRLPDWREMTVSFDEDRFIQTDKADNLSSIYAASPYGEVQVTRSPTNTQANHYGLRRRPNVARVDVGQILSRVGIDRAQAYQVETQDDREVLILSENIKYFAFPKRDLITARLSGMPAGPIYSASLQFYHERPTKTDGIWMPRLTMNIRRKSRDSCRVQFYIIRKAELDKPPEDKDFRVPLYRGDTYVSDESEQRYVVRMPMTLTDILDKPPSLVRDLIEHERRNPGP
ncbi:hypothetical protein [Blastopirellula marina]|uniref:Uncharacterized protein n=1 Tax=Blastopirellula marina TaxID=124 RepID=A0A2S8GP54_9BACT|nr:hypothetical protein [Blastopirellula marina]PQO46205.1 hypothetical protein C5Y93_09465 [Blastopirellula marina]